jgi:hypothetical protein
MHIILVLIIAGSLFWGLLAFTPYLLAHGWPASVAIPFVTLIDLPCGLSAFYLVDLLKSHYRKNNEFLRRFYAELHADLLVLLFFSAILFAIFSLASTSYSLSNIDIACLGIPLFIYAIDTIARARDPVGILPFGMVRRLAYMTLPAVMLVACGWMLIRIYSGEVPAAASLWVQVCIFLAGFSSYVAAKQLGYSLKHRRLGISPTLQQIFLRLRGGKPGIYDEAVVFAEHFQKKMLVATSKAAADRRKSVKRKKSRR